MLAVLVVCLSMVLMSEAIIFNENMLMTMMMMNPQFGQSMFGGGGGGMQGMMPLLLLSGNDKFKNLGHGLLMSRMMMGGLGGLGGASAGEPGSATQG